MSQTPIVYEASVYSRKVSYTNFKGETNEVELFFALDPLKLMQVMAAFSPKASKSGNPALAGKPEALSDADQLAFVRDLAVKAAGFPSDDGESWSVFQDFEDSLAGKAFLTKLASSDGDRKEFADKVIMDPFRAFVSYAKADPSNSPAEVQQFTKMLTEMEQVFAPKDTKETIEERRARLEAEMALLNQTDGDA